MLAPPIDAKHYSQTDLEWHDEYKSNGQFEDTDEIVKFTLWSIREEQNAVTRKALKAAATEIGASLFERAIFRFSTDLFTEQEKGGYTDAQGAPPDSITATAGKHLMARLKRLRTALSVTRRAVGGPAG